MITILYSNYADLVIRLKSWWATRCRPSAYQRSQNKRHSCGLGSFHSCQSGKLLTVWRSGRELTKNHVYNNYNNCLIFANRSSHRNSRNVDIERRKLCRAGWAGTWHWPEMAPLFLVFADLADTLRYQNCVQYSILPLQV